MKNYVYYFTKEQSERILNEEPTEELANKLLHLWHDRYKHIDQGGVVWGDLEIEKVLDHTLETVLNTDHSLRNDYCNEVIRKIKYNLLAYHERWERLKNHGLEMTEFVIILTESEGILTGEFTRYSSLDNELSDALARRCPQSEMTKYSPKEYADIQMEDIRKRLTKELDPAYEEHQEKPIKEDFLSSHILVGMVGY